MLKILSTSQIREADQATISNEPIASIDLMERAATACFEWIKFHFHEQTTFTVIAGVGNNGGDALVVARLLRSAGYDLHTFLVQYSDKLSPDAQINLERLGQSGIEVSIISKSSELPQIGSDDVLIDGIFGSGLSRPAEGVAKSVIDLMNAHSNRIISIDIPSGMYADKPTVSSDSVVHASHTLSLELPKLSFLFPSSEDYVGQMSIIPIGLDHDFIESVESPYNFVDGIDEFKADFERGSFGHKGDYGYCLLLSGSYGMMGAAVLAARSALRAGA
ncbi:MAG: NAD(P)H-hydrate epimerase, partial [Flavobacteriales bacterium]|nr:NAD(P)H-hydrate epimerase [Flavobacteriales bacterium]